MKLDTERLTIRDIQKYDFDDICEYGTDKETGKYMLHWPKPKEEIRSFIDDRIEGMKLDQPKWFEYVIELILLRDFVLLRDFGAQFIKLAWEHK